MKILLRCLAVGLLWAPSTYGQPTPYQIDARHSTLGFAVKIAGGFTEVEGRFTDFEGVIHHDPDDPSASTFAVTIQAASINTGHTGRDEHLRSDDFFDVATHPAIAFHSERVVRRDEGFVMTGPLTMRGVTRTIDIPFQRQHEAPVVWLFGTPTIIFEGGLTLNRKTFNIQANARWNRLVVATGELAMADEVSIHLRVIAEGPGLDAVLEEIASASGLDAAIRRYHALKADYADTPDALGPATLNSLGYRLLRAERLDDAVAIFELYVAEYPDDYNAHDSLGEAHLLAGHREQAIEHYKKSLELNPENTNAADLLRQLDSQ